MRIEEFGEGGNIGELGIGFVDLIPGFFAAGLSSVLIGIIIGLLWNVIDSLRRKD
jgi:hypothetical protein